MHTHIHTHILIPSTNGSTLTSVRLEVSLVSRQISTTLTFLVTGCPPSVVPIIELDSDSDLFRDMFSLFSVLPASTGSSLRLGYQEQRYTFKALSILGLNIQLYSIYLK